MFKYASRFDRVQYGAIMGIVLVLAVVGSLQVISRYVLGSAYSWTEELSRFLLIWLVMLAAAAEVHRGGHIAMTMLTDKFSEQTKRFAERVSLLFILAFAVVLTLYGYDLAMRTMAQRASTLPVTIGFVYLALPLGGVLMAINALRRFVWGRRPSAEPPISEIA